MTTTAAAPTSPEVGTVAPALLSFTSASAAALSDDELIAAQGAIAESMRLLSASAAILAAETAHRSRRELGHSGLAQRRGVRTPEALIQHVTGVSGVDARSLIRVGTLVTQHETAALPESIVEPDAPWLAAVATAVGLGRLSVAAAEVIRVGLGEPTEGVTAEALGAAATTLVREAREVTLERLAAMARARRDDLDAAGIALREQERRDRRYLHLIPQADGMTLIKGLLDPESAAKIVGAIDRVTAPRRGAPRFLDAEELARAKAIEDDPRTTPQLALDALVEMVTIATHADGGRVFGARRVAVRVHIAERDLRRGEGAARIEGQTDPVSAATAERIACDAGIIPVVFDSFGQVLNLGRTQRTFSQRQRIALAARDGGCVFGECDRPPEWCEAHHIDEWLRDDGRTDIADGVLLCHHHHMLLHNNGWRITREGADYFLIPPESESDRTPIRLKQRPMARLEPAA